jgi:hypothetical protein
MTTLRKAAQQALEVLILAPTIKVWTSDDDYCEQESPECKAAITALRAALAEPEQEPEQEDAVYWYVGADGKYYSSHEAELFLDSNTKALHKKPPQWRLDKGDLIPLVAYRQPITITGTYEEFIEFVNMACLHETIYDDSEGRQILVLRMLDAYGMAHSWALEHTRNNLS